MKTYLGRGTHGRATIDIDTIYDVIKIADNLHVFRRTETRRVHSRKGVAATTEQNCELNLESAIDWDNWKKMLAGQPHVEKRMVIMTADSRETVRQRGWVAIDELTIDHNVYSRFFNETATLEDLVRRDPHLHLLFDYQDRPLPVAMRFDYFANFDESHYDLPKALAHLQTRPDIALLGDNDCYTPFHPIDASNAITLIPGYNAQPGRTQQLQFRWMPSVEDYRRLMDAVENYKGGTAILFQHCFDLDMFELRKAGIARTQTYDN